MVEPYRNFEFNFSFAPKFYYRDIEELDTGIAIPSIKIVEPVEFMAYTTDYFVHYLYFKEHK